MTQPLATREARESKYQAYKAVLDDLLTMRAEHVARTPACGAEPLCAGSAVMHLINHGDPSTHKLLLLVAMRELAEGKAERARLLDRLGDLDQRLAAAEADLTMWQDAADAVGPVGLPVE